MPFNHRQLPLPPFLSNLLLHEGNPEAATGRPRTHHLHGQIDCSIDLLRYRGCLGESWEYPTEQSRAKQDEQVPAQKASNAPDLVQYSVPRASPMRRSLPISEPRTSRYVPSPPLGPRYQHLLGHSLQRPSTSSAHVEMRQPFNSSIQVATYDPTIETLTATAGSQDVRFGGDSEYTASGRSYSQQGSATPMGIQRTVENVPVSTPGPVQASSSRSEPAEDLSSFPLQIREALEISAQIGAREPNSPEGTAVYELVHNIWVKEKKETGSERKVGIFRNRHTANLEAAKLFLHKFYVQVVERQEEYRTYMEEAGIMTLEMDLDSRERRMMCVYVRRKSSPSLDIDPQVAPLQP